MWNHVTFFGDSSFTLPCSALLFLWLSYNKQWRAALFWAISFGAAMFLVAASKVMFMAWHLAPPVLGNFTGISGHTASATALYLALSAVLFRDAGRAARLVTLALATALVFTIAISRVALRVHSGSEVILGLAVGAAAALLFALNLHSPAEHAPSLRGKLLMPLLMLGVLLLTEGRPAPTQDFLTQVAQALSGRGQVYGRSAPL